jgi:hypothetical protein
MYSFNSLPTATDAACQTATAPTHGTIAHQPTAHQQSVMEAVVFQIVHCLETDFGSTHTLTPTGCKYKGIYFWIFFPISSDF